MFDKFSAKQIYFSGNKENLIKDLSSAGKSIFDNKKIILETWATKVREQIKEAKNLSHPILIDTMPAILDNLAEALSPPVERQIASLDSTLSLEHGGERARLTEFDITAVINEFRILRMVLIETLKNLSKVSEQEIQIIHVFIDEAIQSSATAFSLVQFNMREQIIATITHDMRSPLTASTLAAESIIRKSKDETAHLHAKKVVINNRRIDGMIQDLLNASLIRSGRKIQLVREKVNLNKLFHEIVEDLAPIVQAQVKLKLQDITGVWDKSHIRRAIENLIMNAYKYGDHSKDITIHAHLAEGRVQIKVHNFGRPIPKEEQETIFQIYRRAETVKGTKRPGWGLGLPIVRAVAEAHGGSVAVNSIKDNGTTFILDIPQSE